MIYFFPYFSSDIPSNFPWKMIFLLKANKLDECERNPASKTAVCAAILHLMQIDRYSGLYHNSCNTFPLNFHRICNHLQILK